MHIDVNQKRQLNEKLENCHILSDKQQMLLKEKHEERVTSLNTVSTLVANPQRQRQQSLTSVLIGCINYSSNRIAVRQRTLI